MIDEVRQQYEEVPYTGGAYWTTHPDRLNVIARMYGMAAPAITRCRVLELGCALGANVVPMAYGMPEAEFVGVDISPKQIEVARQRASELGVKNVRLEARDIAVMGREFGAFDYIICHGVYSWVPGAVQEKILQVCAEGLAENGVALVSYNTYPGWHQNETIRDLMLMHTEGYADPKDKLAHGAAFLDFLARSATAPQSPYAQTLQGVAKELQGTHASYVYHEYLEPVNEPVYFREFMRRAQASGLEYLHDARSLGHKREELPLMVQETLRSLAPEYLRAEQYLDLLENRKFRSSILVRAGKGVQHIGQAAAIEGMYLASAARPVSGQVDLAAGKPERFTGPRGSEITATATDAKLALLELGRDWPAMVSWEALWKRVSGHVEGGSEGTEAGMAERKKTLMLGLWGLARKDILELSSREACWVARAGERPVVSKWARMQAQTSNSVTTMRHDAVSLEPWMRPLLLLLDGTRDQAGAVEALVDVGRRGVMQFTETNEKPITGEAPLREMVTRRVREVWPWLAQARILVG